MTIQSRKQISSFVLAISLIFSISCLIFSAETTIQDVSDSPTWNGLSLSNEYDDYSFEFINVENEFPFIIEMTVQQDSVRYNNRKVDSYVEIFEENSSNLEPEKILTYEFYMPVIDLDSLEFQFVIRLKDDVIDDKYDIFIWNDAGTEINVSISEEETTIPLELDSIYSFILFVDDEIFYIGNFSDFREENNKVYLSYDYLEINDENKLNRDTADTKAEFSGYYTTVVVPANFSIDEVKKCTGNYPTYETVYISKGENLDVSSYSNNSTVYRSAISSPAWYSQTNADALRGSWSAMNLHTLYYSTSTNLSSSTITVTKPFYSTTETSFMNSGCALTCLAMLYRNKNASVTRSYDYRGISLSVKTVDPFTMSLVNTAKTSATGTTLINNLNYYIVSYSPVYVSWGTCASYFGDTQHLESLTSYTTDQKAALIASRIDSYDGGVVVLFQSGTSSHYLLFTSYTLSNGTYTFTVCDPAATTYVNGVTSLENVSISYSKTLANAINIRYFD